MFNIGGGEFVLLGLLALLIFGPDQLPKAAAQVGRVLRQLRTMADSARSDIQKGLGPEFKDFDVEDLNPRRFVQKHFWEAGDDGAARRRRPASQLNGKRPPFDSEAT
ncbi:Sec-independent protein translocase subunit TatB [Streptomonospora sp. S1-112]|uniref:Sec-independent protein translocase subunit TatB n=1 Tax=Streptomonospora mangrovi TaxID=2883123 RepID=A0A9X3NM84_9ACTN|nr:sec-independent translocase [Streptomonospora mangrovi]MDA0564399.1 Sec-independent protein translocase subunit TatB [Streptomonospora mangrovi]